MFSIFSYFDILRVEMTRSVFIRMEKITVQLSLKLYSLNFIYPKITFSHGVALFKLLLWELKCM